MTARAAGSAAAGRRGRVGRGAARLGVLVAAVFAGLAALPGTGAQAHPLGNFTVNQYSGLRLSTGAVTVDYVLDMAELPAFQARGQQLDSDHDGAVSAAESAAYARTTCATVATATQISVDGSRVAVAGRAGPLTFPPGAAGLSTLRLECTLSATVHLTAEAEIRYTASAYADRIGWREVTAVGDGVSLLASDVPRDSATARLTRYPDQALNTPRDARTATVRVRPGGAGAAPVTVPGAAGAVGVLRGVDGLTARFTELVGRRDLSVGLAALAVLLSLLLGAGHALAPGHGKTVLAAYLVGQRGALRHALTVAATVAATHTVGVLTLGVVLATSVWFAPQQIYGWLAVASGALIAMVGASLLRRAYLGWRGGHPHGHGHDHPHPHPHGTIHGHTHTHPHGTIHGTIHGHTHTHPHGTIHGHTHTHIDTHGPVHGHGHGHGRGTDGGHSHDHPDVRGHVRGHVPGDDGDHSRSHDHDHGSGHEHDGRPGPGPGPGPGHGDRAGRGGAGSGGGALPRLRSLIAMGFAGGLSPSPSAVVVLLGAVALGRAWFGVLLVIGYGVGMAATLTGLGLALARWRVRLERRAGGRTAGALRRLVPVATSAVVLLVGLGIAGQAAAGLI